MTAPALFGPSAAATLAPQPIASEEPTACEAPPEPPVNADRTEPSVVLIVLDGVRWQDVMNGADQREAHSRHWDASRYAGGRKLVPNLYRLGERGAMLFPADTHPISATGPNFISLPGYMEIFAGRPYPACDSNSCKRPQWAPLPDLLRSHGFLHEEVAVFSSWSTIGKAASANPEELAISCGRGSTESAAILGDPRSEQLIREGDKAKAFPGSDDYRPDRYTAKAALHYLETKHPRFMFIGLGDTDEFAHMNDYKGYLEALHAADETIGDVMTTLDREGAYGKHATVLVTTDHGRAWNFHDHGREFPESGRVWLVAGGGGVRPHHGTPVPSRAHTLSDIAPTVLHLLGVNSARDGMSGVSMDDLSSRGTVANR